MIEDLPEKFCFQPPYNGRNFTNRVLYEDKIEMAKKRITYYCPAYMRIKIKNFTELNHQDLQAGINVNIILTINCRGIKPLIQAKIKEMLRISFNRDDSVKVEQNSHNIKPECDGVYSFVIAMNVHVAMNPDVFISPFEILNLLMSISIQDIQINEQIIKEVKENAKLQIKRLKIQNELDFHSEQKIGEEVEGEGTENNDNISNDYIIQKLNEEIQQLNKISAFYVRFNLMDTNASRLKMNYTSQGTFGNYDLVQSGLSVEYTNHSVNKSVRLKKKNNFSREEEAKNADYSLIRPFKHAHFEIPIYKFPMVTIATIFIPLWLLGIITVGIYFQDTVLVDRIVSISALLIAFVQIISVIREQLPPSPSVSLLQILVYAQIIGTCMLCLLESIQMEIGPIDYNFIWYQSWSFITSCIVLLVQFIVILVLIIVHKFVWQPRYNREPTSFKLGSFDYKKWQNNECQKHFHRKIDSKLIKILKVQNEFEKIKDYLISLTQQQKQEIAQKLKNESGNESKLQFLRIIVQNLGS